MSFNAAKSQQLAQQICEGYDEYLVAFNLTAITNNAQAPAEPLIIDLAEDYCHALSVDGDDETGYTAHVYRYSNLGACFGDNGYLVATIELDGSSDMYAALNELFWEPYTGEIEPGEISL